ncbi:hypothetical protein BAOM_4261 [Peribacillus asahii]|uniref:Uncharacterized protein n=1 Tax=Peribacillus asahii TaxID=228899 RepID=A0A3T0KWX4_9BACI|nr:hypothetical protein [Peribacillus asahii]AZV44842.1 hypothetical protein BAOM_4261 [Peribacillus asahii]
MFINYEKETTIRKNNGEEVISRTVISIPVLKYTLISVLFGVLPFLGKINAAFHWF